VDLRLLLSRKLRHDFLAAEGRRRATVSDTTDWSRWQLDAVRPIWADAISDIPYYSKLVATGQAPGDLCSWDDFRAIPILTRQNIQNAPDDFVRRSQRPKSFVTTAGSVGTPLRFGMDQASRDLMRVVKLAAWMDFGYTPSSRLFLIWGHAHLLGTGWRGKVNHLKRQLSDAFLGYNRVDAYRLNRDICLQFAAKLLRFRPLGLIGYASALDLFARYTSEFRSRFRNLGLRFVLATAEPIPHPETLDLLEDMFGCPVVQEYGGAEFGQVAFKSGKQPFKVYDDLVYCECLPVDAEDPTAQPVLVTTLYPRYVPLFRYRVGDALLGPERMPHGHVVQFDAIRGRLNDMLILNDGSSIHSVAIFHCIHQEPTILNIQMLLKDDEIEISLISTKPGDADVEARIRGRLAQVHPQLGEGRVTYSEDVATTRAGKRRWFLDFRNKPPHG
jgi:phenylacetate-CoA ligase